MRQVVWWELKKKEETIPDRTVSVKKNAISYCVDLKLVYLLLVGHAKPTRFQLDWGITGCRRSVIILNNGVERFHMY
ncbi:hypothetical protein GCM10028810_04950 [Spirosoma litoris]